MERVEQQSKQSLDGKFGKLKYFINFPKKKNFLKTATIEAVKRPTKIRLEKVT